jgi:hypothetical protein
MLTIQDATAIPKTTSIMTIMKRGVRRVRAVEK